jgi:F0F1-type ATP synthase epsilon subunit
MVSISTLNSAPIADAGLDQSPVIGETVTLDGSNSSDADGDTLSSSWSFVARPAESAALLSDTTASQPTFTVDMAGSYIVQLIVNDGVVDSQPDTVTISTENSAPVANAGNAQTVDIGATATLDGSASSDVDGDLLNFSWSFMSLPEGSQAVLSDPTAAMPSLLVDLPGTYVVQLIVNDGWGDSTPDTVSITTENSAPSASAGPNQTVTVGSTVLLDGSASSDPDGDQLTYSWSLVSFPPESAATLSDLTDVAPSFYVDYPGTYVVQLIVSDGLLESIPDTVTISTGHSAPTADAGKRMRARIGDTVTLSGSNSSDLDGDSLNFSWSFVSLPEGSTANLSDPAAGMPDFVADLPGVYIVQLIVNDGTVDSVPDSCTIRVRRGGKPHRDNKPGKGDGSGNNSEPR